MNDIVPLCKNCKWLRPTLCVSGFLCRRPLRDNLVLGGRLYGALDPYLERARDTLACGPTGRFFEVIDGG